VKHALAYEWVRARSLRSTWLLLAGAGVPQFASGLLNFRLAPDSPLVNRGFDLSSGDIGAWDLAGGERLQGVHVDIGAYESDVLLRDGFDPG